VFPANPRLDRSVIRNSLDQDAGEAHQIGAAPCYDAILEAAALAGGGGIVGYLQQQAVQNPRSFSPLLGKVMPTQLSAESENSQRIVVMIDPEDRKL
jgi:hypothetical protein